MTLRFSLLGLFLLLICSQAKAQFLEHIVVQQTSSSFNYTLFNDEKAGSPNYIDTFQLTLDAPLSSVSAPAGWDFTTNNKTFVSFYNTDANLPYPHDIAPGNSLGGFNVITSVTTSDLFQSALSTWDHTNDVSGPSMVVSLQAPSGTQAVPEPSVWVYPVVVLASLACVFLRLGFKHG